MSRLGAAVRCALVASAIGAIPCLAPTLASAQAHAQLGGFANVREACAPPAPGFARCFALVREREVPVVAGRAELPAARRAAGSAPTGPAGGLTPEDLATAYDYSPSSGGAGQTVGIVDAYDDPNIQSDLGAFDAHYGLPECTSANGCLKKVGQTGGGVPAADKKGWSVEITLDVETVHAACPNCKILLVEASSAADSNLATAANEAVALGATVVSNSFGTPEADYDEAEVNDFNHPGVPIVASTGDWGWDNWNFFEEESRMANDPAALPTVVAVGGTRLELNADGTRASESIWNWTNPEKEESFEGASGGGCSSLYEAQPWQRSVAGYAATGCGGKRLDADVAADADPETGLDVYDTYDCGKECKGADEGWVTIGGTSLSAPLIGALYALAGGGHGVSYPSLTLYGHGADATSRFDVTKGGDGYCDGEPAGVCGHPNTELGAIVDCEGTTACDAAAGFDGPSGVGTPNGLGLFEPELPTASFTLPESPKAGLAASFSGAASSDPYPGGSIASYSWNWGDGTAPGSGSSPSHTYVAAGKYLVSLTVTDSYGLTSASSTKSVEVLSETQAEEEAIAKQHREEEAARRKHEEEATAKHEQEEEAAAERRREEEAAVAKDKQEEEVAKRKQEEEAAAGRKHEEALAVIPTVQLPTTTSGQGVSGFHSSVSVPDARLTRTALVASATGVLKLSISCPADQTSCKGTVTLRTLTAVSASLSSTAGKKAILTLASASFSVVGGKTATVTLHLTAQARALLARLHTLRAVATIVAHDTAGQTHTTKSTVTLREAPSRHGTH